MAFIVFTASMPVLAFAEDGDAPYSGHVFRGEPAADTDDTAIPEDTGRDITSGKERAEDIALSKSAGKTAGSSYYDDDDDWYLDYDSYYFYYNDDYMYLYASGAYISRVTSSNTNVVTVGDIYYDSCYDEDYVELYRVGGGKATIKVWAYDGTYRTCQITSEKTPVKTVVSNQFNKKTPYNECSIYNYYWGKDREIVKAVSSKPKVASVSVRYGSAIVTAKKAGKTRITFTDRGGVKKTVTITVSKAWKKANLKYYSGASVQYESKKAYVYSKPGAKVTLKIGGKTYKKKIGKKGYAYIKLKKNYKVKTKYSLKCSYKGAKATVKGKVNSYTSAYVDGSIWSCKYYVPVVVYNAKKGDTLYVTVNGRTYKQKIYGSGTYRTTVWLDSRLGCVPYIKIRVKNKYKQTTWSNTETFRWY